MFQPIAIAQIQTLDYRKQWKQITWKQCTASIDISTDALSSNIDILISLPQNSLPQL